MKWDAFLLALVLVLNLQIFPFGNHLAVMNAFPNLLFCLLIYAALYFPFHTAFAAAFATGLALDLFSAYPFHVQTMLCLVFASLVNSQRDMLFKDHPLTQVMLVFFLMWAYQSVYVILIKTVYLHELPALLRLRQAIPIALYTAVVSPLFFKIAHRYCRLWNIRRTAPRGVPV